MSGGARQKEAALLSGRTTARGMRPGEVAKTDAKWDAFVKGKPEAEVLSLCEVDNFDAAVKAVQGRAAALSVVGAAPAVLALDELRERGPTGDQRRAIIARDALACVDGFLTIVQLVMEYLFGMRCCIRCPDCACSDLFGSNAKPEGGRQNETSKHAEGKRKAKRACKEEEAKDKKLDRWVEKMLHFTEQLRR